MAPVLEATLILGSYLLGSVPFALLLGRTRGIDIRQLGSGNVGATNLGRALGRRWATAAFVLDFLKGLAPVIGMRSWGGVIGIRADKQLVDGGGLFLGPPGAG